MRETGITVTERTDYEAQLNQSIDDVIDLLEREIRRLQASLETYRLSDHPRRGDIIRWHVKSLDERHDALEELRALMVAQHKGGDLIPH